MSAVPRGRFCWHELMTTDPEGAQTFYTKVMGWDTEAWEGGEMPYTMWSTATGPIGGVMELPEPARELSYPAGISGVGSSTAHAVVPVAELPIAVSAG